jgi:epoxyqueuosine reductase
VKRLINPEAVSLSFHFDQTVSNTVQHTRIVKETALSLGFDFCGIAKVQKLDDDAHRLEQWLNKGMHGSMKYMENYFELRVDPQKLVPGARSVITLLINYFPSEKQNKNSPKISRYAYGKDYHEVIKNKLQTLLKILHEKIGEVHGRGFVDSAPVLERSWAQRSGLGLDREEREPDNKNKWIVLFYCNAYH